MKPPTQSARTEMDRYYTMPFKWPVELVESQEEIEYRRKFSELMNRVFLRYMDSLVLPKELLESNGGTYAAAKANNDAFCRKLHL